MKTIYLPVANQLKTEVTTLRWIDADMGQLDFYDTKPPVAFPCALIDVDMPACEDMAAKEQLCDITISVRLAFNPLGQTNMAAPTSVQNTALELWATVDSAFDSLQGFSSTEFGKLSRASQITEKRPDGLKVIKQIWKATLMESVTTS